MHSRNWIRFFHGLLPNVVEATFTPPKSRSLTKMLIPKTDRNPNLFFPAQIQPSPGEMEHVSTTPKVTVTTRLVGRFLLSGYGRWWSVLSRKSSISNESSSFLRFSGLSDRVSPVCAQWSRQQPLSGFRPEVEPVSTNLFGGSQGGISSTSTVVESF